MHKARVWRYDKDPNTKRPWIVSYHYFYDDNDYIVRDASDHNTWQDALDHALEYSFNPYSFIS